MIQWEQLWPIIATVFASLPPPQAYTTSPSALNPVSSSLSRMEKDILMDPTLQGPSQVFGYAGGSIPGWLEVIVPTPPFPLPIHTLPSHQALGSVAGLGGQCVCVCRGGL